VAAAGIVGVYGGALYSYYKFLCWLEGPRRRTMRTTDGSMLDEDLLNDMSSLVSGSQVTDDELMRELDLDMTMLKHMEPEDRMKFIDAKLKSITIAKRKKIFKCLKKQPDSNGSTSCELRALSRHDLMNKFTIDNSDSDSESDENKITSGSSGCSSSTVSSCDTSTSLQDGDLGKMVVETSAMNVRTASLLFSQTHEEPVDSNIRNC